MLFSPLANLLASNDYPVFSIEVGMLLTGCFLAGTSFYCLVVKFGEKILAPILLGAVAAFSVDVMLPRGSHLPVLFIIVPCIAGGWILRQHFAFILTVTFAVLVATIFLIPASNVVGASQTTLVPLSDSGGRNSKLPVVLHLILDEHIGIHGLPKELPESAELALALEKFYVGQGFQMYTHAYSEYFDTVPSIPNLLNFTSYDTVRAHLVENSSKPYILKRGTYLRHLSELGYRFYVYQSDYIDYCRVPGVRYASCSTYATHKIGSLYGTRLGIPEKVKFILHALVSTSAALQGVKRRYGDIRASLQDLALPEWGPGNSRVGPIPVLPILKQLETDLRSASHGSVYFAHLLLPHFPYALDASCRLRPNIRDWLDRGARVTPMTAAGREDRYRHYFEQVICQQTLLTGLFDAMKQAGVWADATVIVHGDHGSRIVRLSPHVSNAAALTADDFRDGFSTLYAVRFARGHGEKISQPKPLQTLLSQAFRIPSDESPHKVYLHSSDENQSGLQAHELIGF
jgi:hypothetical protein